MYPPGAPGLALAAGSDVGTTLQQFLAGAQTTEGRVVLSGAVVLVTVALVAVVIPWLARILGRPSADAETASETLSAIRSGVRVLFRRGLQVSLVCAAAVALLVVWGRLDEAVALLERSERPVEVTTNIVITAGLALVAYVAIDVLDDTVARFSDGADRITDHEAEIIRRVGQLSIIALLIATVFTVWGVDLSGLLVGAGFLGIVVGLAARQTLGSLIAGLVLMFSRPFTIGDWVEIGDQEGIVTDITIVNTRLENFDGEFVVIPNDIVGNQPITNRSQKGHLRLRLDVGVDYGSDPDYARDVALEAMRDLTAIEQTPPPQAFLKSFGDSAVVIELRFWIDRPTPPRKWQATSAVVDAVKSAFEAEGIKIPFPQRELSGRAETGGFQIQSEAIDPERTRGTVQRPAGRPTTDGDNGVVPAEADPDEGDTGSEDDGAGEGDTGGDSDTVDDDSSSSRRAESED